MANNVIAGTGVSGATALPVAVSVDRVNDFLPIYTASATATQGITPNLLLGITGAPIGTTDSQTLSNKTIGITNTLTILDTLFTLEDNGDNTKKMVFQLSGITTGTTRTLTVPDISDTLTTNTATQTLTNKTLTSPTINTPTITNATISADTITGFSTSNSGTIYGIAVTTGAISGANTVSGGALTSNSIPAGVLQTNSVSGANLATSAITLGYAQITTNFVLSSSQTTPTQITGLTATVTVPAGGRKVRITGFCTGVTLAGGVGVFSIWDGVVNSGTQIGQGNIVTTTGLGIVEAVVAPSAGSKTYNLGISNTGTNNTTIGAASTQPAFILVEAI